MGHARPYRSPRPRPVAAVARVAAGDRHRGCAGGRATRDRGAVQPCRPGLGRRRAGGGAGAEGREGAERARAGRQARRDQAVHEDDGPQAGRPGPRSRPRPQRRAGDGAACQAGPRRHRQPPQRRPGLLRPADQALPLPGDRARREVQPAGDVRLPLPVDQPAAVRPAALRPQGPADRRRHDDHRQGRPGAVRRTP